MTGRFRLVLFDLDGTLIDSAPDLCAALAVALTEVNLPIHDVDAVRKMIGEGQRTLCERAVLRAGGDLGLVDEVLQRFRRHYSQHLVEKTTVYPGALALLSFLSPRLPLGIATNKPGTWARQIAQTLELAPHFRWVLGEDDVGARKPDPRLLLSICEQAHVAPADALMVGDSAIDVAAAEAAGLSMALVTYGFGDANSIAEDRSAPLGSAARPHRFDAISGLRALFPF